MKKETCTLFFKLVKALFLGLLIDVFALAAAPFMMGFLPSYRWLGAFITHSVMALLSLALIYFFSRGAFHRYGFRRDRFVFKPTLLLWVLPMATLSIIGFFATSPQGEMRGPFGYSHLESILFIWIYASVCEEIFTRGFLQSYLEPLRKYGFTLLKRWRLSVPVLFSGIFFGLMHIVAIKAMGPPVLVFTTILGLVAGYYREKTGSLWPAIIIHALFNVGGMAPPWILNIFLR
ncbi:lysostaphin resistance A-like protein [candidate division CSSED10-310 bacterium]|uniref:Lysostaphin resistance A-like protein n=1 Tax=candidate division CSSED10-310 bacterium TaxID=2855610 RepID=A0ABV6YVJ1_UNCC1